MPDFLRRPLIAAVSLLAIVLMATACGGAGGATPAETTGGNEQLAARGAQLFTQLGCNTCHGTRGERLVGPPLNGLYGKQVTLEGGQTVTADEAYLRESILEPDAKIVQGYPQGVMAGALADKMNQIRQDDNVAALVAYVKSLK